VDGTRGTMAVRKWSPFLAPFASFAKTGSGQTFRHQENVEKKGGSRRVGSEADGVCAYTLAHYPAAEVRKRISFAIPFHYGKNDQFTQTGSGQT